VLGYYSQGQPVMKYLPLSQFFLKRFGDNAGDGKVIYGKVEPKADEVEPKKKAAVGAKESLSEAEKTLEMTTTANIATVEVPLGAQPVRARKRKRGDDEESLSRTLEALLKTE